MADESPGNEKDKKKKKLSKGRQFINRLRQPPIPRSGTSVTAQRLELVITAANSASMGMIFAFREFLPKIFRGLGRSILFPFNAACNIIRAVLALYEAHKEGYKTPALLRALVAVVSGMAIGMAIIGALVATAAFSVIGPILSIVGFSLRSIFHGSSAIYFGVHSYLTNVAKDAAKYWDKAISNSVSAIQSMLNVIAIAMVLIAFKASFGIMGLIAGALGATYQIYRAAHLEPPPPPAPEVPLEPEVELKAKSQPELPRRNSIDMGVEAYFQKRAAKRRPISPPSPTLINSLTSTFYGSRSRLSREPSPFQGLGMRYDPSYSDFPAEWGTDSQELSRPPSVAPGDYNRNSALSPTSLSRQTTEQRQTPSASPSSFRRHSL